MEVSWQPWPPRSCCFAPFFEGRRVCPSPHLQGLRPQFLFTDELSFRIIYVLLFSCNVSLFTIPPVVFSVGHLEKTTRHLEKTAGFLIWPIGQPKSRVGVQKKQGSTADARLPCFVKANILLFFAKSKCELTYRNTVSHAPAVASRNPCSRRACSSPALIASLSRRV